MCVSAGGVRAALATIFAGGNEAGLRAEDTEWARATLEALLAMPPSSVCWSLATIRRGGRLSLADALAAELLQLTRHVRRHPYFAEGVRELVVYTDRAPKWSSPTLAEADAAAIAAMVE